MLQHEVGPIGYDPALQESFNHIWRALERNNNAPSSLTLEEAIQRLLDLRSHDLDLKTVVNNFNPHHVHWKEYPGRFDPGTGLYRWLHGWGSFDFLVAKFQNRFTNMSAIDLSHRLYQLYFEHHGIRGDIQVAGEGLLDYHTGVRIDSQPADLRWRPKSVVKLFPEVDFQIAFDLPDASQEVRHWVKSQLYLLVNTTKVVGTPLYRPHILGYPQRPDQNATPLINGRGYLRRVSTQLKGMGIVQGIDNVVATNKSELLIETLLAARRPRSSQPRIDEVV